MKDPQIFAQIVHMSGPMLSRAVCINSSFFTDIDCKDNRVG